MTALAPSDAEAAFRAALAERILVKDGPYGTAIQALGLAEADYRGNLAVTHDQKGNNDILNLTRPHAIAAIARAYAEAGADLLATNSFNANAISQADYGTAHLVADINRAAAEIVRAVADEAAARDGRRRFVAGALGPTNKTLSLSPRVEDPGFREVDFDGVKAVYREQVDALLEGGADFILIETVFDTLNAKAAAMAAMEAEDARGQRVPLLLSMTLTDLAGRNLSGQTVEAFWVSLAHARPLAVGLNCSFGATELSAHVANMARIAEAPLLVYPNAGLPNAFGGYDEAPATTAALVRQWAEAGLVNIIGGCCGTTPAHIAAIRAAVAGLPPRRIPEPVPALRLSGLEAFAFA
ncbi:homocysteine S-methyltransferase family protein [Thermaurantiacus sp.]